MTIIKQVAVIGSGTMGRQIALQVARHGFPVTLYDIDASALEKARTMQKQYAREWVDAGDISAHDVDAIFARMNYATDLETAVRDANLAIEAIPERIEMKRKIFAQLDGLLREHAIIATNSASMRVSAPNRSPICTFICQYGIARWSKSAAGAKPIRRC